MNKADVREAVPLADRMLARLASTVPSRGRPGFDVRVAIGYLRANLFDIITNNLLGEPLDQCFDLARLAGATQFSLAGLRGQLEAERPVLLGAVLVKNAGLMLCLATEARIIADTDFVSRQDVDAYKQVMAAAFYPAEEIAADDMDAATYLALIALHGALTNYLVTRARPLPRLISYEFAEPLPTSVIAYRLYYDADRAIEIRNENKIVHPLFCPTDGKALSA